MTSEKWRTATIGTLIDEGIFLVHKDGNHGSNYPRTSEFGSEGVPFLTAKLLDDAGNIDFVNAPRLANEKANKFIFGFIETDDVLLSHNATVGRVAVVPKINERVLIGTSLTHFRLDKNRLLPKYLAVYFSGCDFQNQLAAVMSQTTRNQVPITSQRKLNVVVPPMSEQKRIADTLSSFDDKIQLNRQINQTLEQIAQAIFKSWFVDFEPVKAKIVTKQALSPALYSGHPALHPSGRTDVRSNPLPADLSQREREKIVERAAMRAISGKTDEELDQLEAQGCANVAGGRTPGVTSPSCYEQLAATAALFPDELEESEFGEIPRGWRFKSISDIANFTSGKVEISSLNLDNYISTENMVENKGGVSRAVSLPSVRSVPSFSKGQVLVSNIRPYFKKIWLARFSGGRSNDVLAFETVEDNCTEFLSLLPKLLSGEIPVGEIKSVEKAAA